MSANRNKEIEVKFYIEDLGALEARLIALKAECVQARTHEYNLRFDTPDEVLKQKLHLLRLRQDNHTTLTFKGRSDAAQGVLDRVEIEVEISDFETTRQLLEALGYGVTFIYEKYRAMYALDQYLVTLDETPLGNFAEIEGPDAKTLQDAARLLELNWDVRALQNYSDLFKRAKAALDIDYRDLTFENLAGITIAPGDLGVIAADG
ncbi:MAG: class IV adenylate cyclase [Anaerolineales bacterium]|nr:class IV adenylate cyclase [Anaerolineales bacterium]